jgi:hypothetical protein
VEVLRVIAAGVRAEAEDYLGFEDDPNCMVGYCRAAARDLVKALHVAGHPARAVMTTYHGIDSGYADLVASRLPAFEAEADDDPDGDCWKHWVVVSGDHIVDVTADQFHPGDVDAEKIVVTQIGDPRYGLMRSMVSGSVADGEAQGPYPLASL